MPGTASGSVDHVSNTASAATQNQEYFTNLYRFFNGPLRSGSYVQLVALQTGSSAGGTNYHNETNPFGENAFCVWRVRSGSVGASGISTRRAQDYYVLFQWADAVSFGTSPGNPGLMQGAAAVDGVGMAIAYRDDGLSPWNGTTLANGNDTKGAQVWTSLTTGALHVFPRSNNVLGTHTANKENTVLLADLGTALVNHRYHFIADRDSFITFYDASDNLAYNTLYIHGTFEPLPGFVTSSGGAMHMPMMQMCNTTNAVITINTAYGGTAGSAGNAGGVVGARLSSGVQVRDVATDRFQNLLGNTNFQPNRQFTLNRYDEFRIPVIIFESPDFGLLGYMDTLTETYNASLHDITSGSLKAILGQVAGATVVYVVPWGGLAPRSTSAREGRFF
jgi:hypothetical protein